MTRQLKLFLIATAVCAAAVAGEASIPAGSKVYIAPMGGFETYLKAAIERKKLSIVLVESRDAASFEISGTAESEKASTAKKVIMLNWHSKEQASVTVTNVASSEVIFAYAVHKESSAHGKQSSAEACAKHLKSAITGASK